MIGNFEKELEALTEYWSPKVVGQVNDQYIKVAKVQGTLAWHAHDDEDEMFYIVKGSLVIEYEDDKVVLNKGDFHIVPRGKMHNPVAENECWLVLVEPVATKHTGNIVTDKTRSIDEQISG